MATKSNFQGPKSFRDFQETGPALGLKKGVKTVAFFGLKYGKHLENWAVHPHQELPGVTAGPRELFSQATSTTVNTYRKR